MENQTPPPASPQAPSLAPQTPPPVFVKKTPMQMIQLFFAGIGAKLRPQSKTPSQPPLSGSTVSAPTISSSRPVPVKKMVIIAAVIFILLMVIIAVVNLLMRQKPPELVPTPTPEATEVPATPPPTRYATDSGVLQIEANINQLDSELTQTDIDEVNLKPRTLNWNINFNEK